MGGTEFLIWLVFIAAVAFAAGFAVGRKSA